MASIWSDYQVIEGMCGGCWIRSLLIVENCNRSTHTHTEWLYRHELVRDADRKVLHDGLVWLVMLEHPFSDAFSVACARIWLAMICRVLCTWCK